MPAVATGNEIYRARKLAAGDADTASREGKAPVSRFAVLLARIVLVSFGVLLIGFGAAAFIEQWPRPSWIIALVIGLGIGCIVMGFFDSPARVVATAVWMILPWP